MPGMVRWLAWFGSGVLFMVSGSDELFASYGVDDEEMWLLAGLTFDLLSVLFVLHVYVTM